MSADLEPAFVSIDDAAKFLGISRSAAYRAARSRQLPGAARVGGRWVVAIAGLRDFADQAAASIPERPRRLRGVA